MEQNEEASMYKNLVHNKSISNQYHMAFGQMESH
jgi:hypothetical protein